MQRKLIQLSPSTAVVSLPASWIKHNRLTKGKAIFVDEQENKLIISAVSKRDNCRCERIPEQAHVELF